MEKQGEAHLRPIRKGEEHLRLFPLEEPFLQHGFIRHHLRLHPLIPGQRPDEAEDQGRILRPRKAELYPLL